MKSSARITIKDVASASGCSIMTVSNVLNSRPGKVTESTRGRVMKVVRDLDYQPSAVARGLQRNRMETIGVVLPNVGASLHSPYFTCLLQGIISAAAELRQNVTLYTAHSHTIAAESALSYQDGRCDGLLLLSPAPGCQIARELTARHFPLVVIGNEDLTEGVACVCVDDVVGGRSATEHLLRAGHRRIGVLLGESEAGHTKKRLQGYKEALSAFGVAYQPEFVHVNVFWPDYTEGALDALLDLGPDMRPTGLFCSNDELAMYAMGELQRRSLRVPEDISVIGHDDLAPAASARPPLTTIRQPLPDMARYAIELLLRQVDMMPDGVEKKIFPTQLVKRDSVAALGIEEHG